MFQQDEEMNTDMGEGSGVPADTGAADDTDDADDTAATDDAGLPEENL